MLSVCRMGVFALLLSGAAIGEESPEHWRRLGEAAVNDATKLEPITTRARNVILFVGDGMGVSTVTAARILEGQQRGATGEESLLAFEQLPFTALSKTYTTDRQTPDSAGTMTAMMTGVKTRSGLVSVDQRAARAECAGSKGTELQTFLELAERAGLATGIVSTARITHATPGATYAHTPERNWEDDAHLTEEALANGCADIARQLIEFPLGDGLEVVLGGGRAQFLPTTSSDPEYPERHGARRDGRDLIGEWLERFERGKFVWKLSQLDKIKPRSTRHLLGLFEPSHMRYETDRARDPGGEPSLARMTELAIELLQRNGKGFFLMVEGGRIDHAHHAGNAYRALTDTIAFSDAVAAAVRKTHVKDTLILVTADHSHTLTISGYAVRGNPILGKAAIGERLLRDAAGLPYTTLSYANGPGYRGASESRPGGTETVLDGRPDLTQVDTTEPDYRQESTVPLAGETHAGEDVPVYASGPMAHLVRGVMEQNVVFHVMMAAVGGFQESSE